MLDRKFKEYDNYLGRAIEADTSMTSTIYNAAQKALKLKDYIVIAKEDTQVSIIPSINEGDYIMVRNVGSDLHISYEKTTALKMTQPFKHAIDNLFKGQEAYGMVNLFKFNSKDTEGEEIFYEKMMSFGKITPEMKEIMLEKDTHKKLELMNKLSEPAGECLASFTDLNTLKIVTDTFAQLKLMKPISENKLHELGSKSGENIKQDSSQFVEDLNFLHSTAKDHKHNTNQPYKFHNDKIWVIESLPQTVCFQSQSTGYLAHGDGKDNWTIYPYSKEYQINDTYKNIVKKIKDNSINDTLEAMLKIENGEITYVGNPIYNMAIELHDCVREYSMYFLPEQTTKKKKPK